MMTISLSEVSKRFNRDWIFRKFSYNFINSRTYAITGPNGSGKSTLLQVIGGAISMSEGEIKYESRIRKDRSVDQQTVIVSPDLAFKYISIAAPYLELVEEMTAVEFLSFHQKFKPLIQDETIARILSLIGLDKAAHKQIRYYSSGMKQRIKLAQAIFSDTPVLLLDEPCTNLDAEGIQLYHHLIKTYCAERLVIVSSNDIEEFGFCESKISIMDYK